MTTSTRLTVTPLGGAMGATVEGLDVDALDDGLAAELKAAWIAHHVLFFPAQHLTNDQHLRLARVFGARLEATTESGKDHRGAPTLADEGYPEILVLDIPAQHGHLATNNWHTDVTFTTNPPIGSLFSMQVPAPDGGDTMWSNQHLAYEGLSAPIRALIADLHAVHGRPPFTSTTEHPMVKLHPETGRPFLFVNRGWTASVAGLHSAESRHLLEMLFERAERPEYQIRWRWSAGDAALWDNRCTMHYAVDDYRSHRRAHRATIYDD